MDAYWRTSGMVWQAATLALGITRVEISGLLLNFLRQHQHCVRLENLQLK